MNGFLFSQGLAIQVLSGQNPMAVSSAGRFARRVPRFTGHGRRPGVSGGGASACILAASRRSSSGMSTPALQPPGGSEEIASPHAFDATPGGTKRLSGILLSSRFMRFAMEGAMATRSTLTSRIGAAVDGAATAMARKADAPMA